MGGLLLTFCTIYLLTPVWDGSTLSHSDPFSDSHFLVFRDPKWQQTSLLLLRNCAHAAVSVSGHSAWPSGRSDAGKGEDLQRIEACSSPMLHQMGWTWSPVLLLSLSCHPDAGIYTVNEVRMEENHMDTVSSHFSPSTELSSTHRPRKKCASSHIFAVTSP